MRLFLTIAFLCVALPAAAQNPPVKQSGNVTPGHPAMWTTNGIIQDGGTAAQGNITSLGVTASGPGICQNSGPISGPYNQICLNVTQTGGGFLSVYNNNGATGGFSFVLNGVAENILVANPPLTTNDGACFFNSTGTIKDCGFVPLSSTGWTANLPLIGSALGGVTQGTLSGNTTKFATLNGAVTTNDCAKWDSSGNIVDAGTTCANNVSSPVYQIFLAPGAVTTLTLTNTPLPTATGLVSIAFDGRLQARDTWSINVVSGVITFNAAIPANVQVVEVDWFAPQAVAGVGSITVGASTLTGSVILAAGNNVTLTPAGQTITVAVPGTIANSVVNSDGTLTISPTSGNVVASLNLGHANTWTANQAISLTGSNFTVSDSGNSRSLQLATNQGGGFSAIVINNGTGTTWQIYDGTNNAGIHFYNGTEQFFIGANGNSGFGTTNPTAQLQLTGKILAAQGEVSGNLQAGVLRGYADLREWASLSCNPAAPVSTNVAAAVVAANGAGWTHFFMPAGCFLYTGDTAWTAHFTLNTIPNGFFFLGEDWTTSGISVCSTYTGCTPNVATTIQGGANSSFQNIFVASGSCYNVDSGAFGNPSYCPIGLLTNNGNNGGDLFTYPFQPRVMNVSPGTVPGWTNGADSPAIAINQSGEGDILFSNDTTTDTSAHYFNFDNRFGPVVFLNIDGKFSIGNTSTSHSGSGMITITDAFASCQIFTNTSGSPGFACLSDKYLKKNIKSAASQLSWLNSFNIRQFDMRSNDQHIPAGIIAQEIEKIHPEMVHQGKSDSLCDEKHFDGCLSVDAPSLWQMMKAMQEMQAEIVMLKRKARIQ